MASTFGFMLSSSSVQTLAHDRAIDRAKPSAAIHLLRSLQGSPWVGARCERCAAAEFAHPLLRAGLYPHQLPCRRRRATLSTIPRPASKRITACGSGTGLAKILTALKLLEDDQLVPPSVERR